VKWPRIPLGDVLRRRLPDVAVDPAGVYQFAGVYSFGRGVFRGIERTGSEFSYRILTRLREGEFVYPKLMAWEGAFGIVPAECSGCCVSPEFPVFEVASDRLLPRFLGLYFQIPGVWESVSGMSIGTNVRRRRLNPAEFLKWRMPLPPRREQQRIADEMDKVAGVLQQVRAIRHEEDILTQRMLLSEFDRVTDGVPRQPMSEVAPIVRRPVRVDPHGTYAELGIRSFGNGTFHKPTLSGVEIGSKRIFRIEPGDLLFSNVFAWEGGIAVAGPEDENRVGSHRYITCVPLKGLATAPFLCFYFLSSEGLDKIKAASPGGAGRNRTLGLGALKGIHVPVPCLAAQVRFDELQTKVRNVQRQQTGMAKQLDGLIPAVRDLAFRGEL
jgi:type I restriction enzyme S subunit